MSPKKPTINYTLTDEAPLLATYSLLPIIRTFTDAANVNVVESDISVAARILGEFSDYLTPEQQVPDNLAELARLTQVPDANIIKLPGLPGRPGNRGRKGDQPALWQGARQCGKPGSP